MSANKSPMMRWLPLVAFGLLALLLLSLIHTPSPRD